MLSIINSKPGKNFKGYNCSILKDSLTGADCILGDFSRAYGCNLEDKVKIDRNNFLLNSNVGRYSSTGQFTVIIHASIGRFCSISWGVSIGGAEHDHKKITTHDFLYNIENDLNPNVITYNRYEKPIHIGHDVWVGANSTIARGVTIGHGAVIGANSMVTKDVPPYAIVGGAPAKIIKYRFDGKIINELLNLAWWDMPTEKIKEHFELFASSDIESTIKTLKSKK